MKSIIKFFPFYLFIISLLVLFYTLYRSEIIWDGVQRYYYSKYYFLSITLAVLSFITYKLSYKLKSYLVILILTSISVLYLSELYLIITNELNFYTNEKFQKEQLSIEKNKNYKREKKINKYELYLSTTGKNYDRRSNYEIYNDLKKINPLVSMVVPPSLYLEGDKIDRTINKKLFPLSGKSNSMTIFCNENGYFSIFKSDRYGFNNPDYIWDKEINYILIGDSFVHGACVNRPNDIASKLRDITNENVLNLGYSGNGPLIQYATIKEYFKKETKHLVWFFYERNDLGELENEKTSSILSNYIKDNNFNQNLVDKQNIINELSDNFIIIEEEKIKMNNSQNKKISNESKDKQIKKKRVADFQNLLTIKFLKIYHLRKLLLKGDEIDFEKIISSVKDFSIQNNTKLYFVYLPEYRRYSQKSFDNNRYVKIKKLIKKLNINFIDIHQEFSKSGDPLQFFPFRVGGHYNIKGYELIANKLSEVSKN